MSDSLLRRFGVSSAFASPKLEDWALAAERLLVAYLFVSEGVGKIAYYAAVQDYMSQHAVNPSLLPLVIALELGAGLAVAVGLLTRSAAVALAGFCLLTALLFHGAGDSASEIEFKKNLALCGGMLALAAHGPGVLSLEAFWSRRRQA